MIRKIFFPNDGKGDHFKALDGLRGLAVLLVIISHSVNQGLLNPDFKFHGVGKLGVFLFFILSAFLLDNQIILKMKSGEAGKPFWRRYFYRRFIRIYPLYCIALCLNFLTTRMGITYAINTPMDILWHLLLLKGDIIYWSIAVEFKYYFISPLILLIFHFLLHWSQFKSAFVLILLYLGSLSAIWFLDLSEISTIPYLYIFLLGTGLAIFKDHIFKLSNSWVKRLDVIAIVLFLLMISTFPILSEKIWRVTTPVSIMKVLSLIVWVLFMVLAFSYGSVVKRLFESTLLRLVGVISFSAYLFHMTCIKMMKIILTPSITTFAITIIISLVVAAISYVIIEKPLLYGRKRT